MVAAVLDRQGTEHSEHEQHKVSHTVGTVRISVYSTLIVTGTFDLKSLGLNKKSEDVDLIL